MNLAPLQIGVPITDEVRDDIHERVSDYMNLGFVPHRGLVEGHGLEMPDHMQEYM